MKEELYYLVPKELMDKLMGELKILVYLLTILKEDILITL
jgi:hypothetical protein